jgi:replication factor C subunit 2/4
MSKAQVPWVEKYRPKCVDEVSHQGEVVNSLRKAIEQKSLPHLIFYGPPGTGKTSTILAAARELFGADYKSRVMELNASDERGIAVVRTKIKGFAQLAVGSTSAKAASSEASSASTPPPYKLIVLDEADSMTADAQSALRRTMETYSKVTRFCIICNYISRLIPPIASRCAKFRFKPLPQEAMVARLQQISTVEGVDISEEGLNELMTQSEGDMRRAIQMLQSLHQLHGARIEPQSVHDISGALPRNLVSRVFSVCRAQNFDAMDALVSELLADGYPAAQLCSQMLEALLTEGGGAAAAAGDLSSSQKAQIAVQLALVDKNLVDGADEYLQLANLFAFTMRQCKPAAA